MSELKKLQIGNHNNLEKTQKRLYLHYVKIRNAHTHLKMQLAHHMSVAKDENLCRRGLGMLHQQAVWDATNIVCQHYTEFGITDIAKNDFLAILLKYCQ